jgi:hypothetical protein
VGIGTTTPTARLTASGSSGSNLDVIVGVNSSTAVTDGKSVGFLLRGSDTAGTLKDAGAIRSVPSSETYANAALTFSTRSGDTLAEQMRITSAGNVGIGTNSPSARLTVSGAGRFIGSSNNMDIGQTGSLGYIETSGATGTPIAFYNSGTERMRIDTNGNIGIGTSSPSTFAGTGGRVLALSSGTTLAGDATYSGYGQTISWGLNIYQNSSNSFIRNFDICAFGDAGNGSGSQFRFLGQNSGATSLVERMRIDNSGNLLVGTTSGTYHNINLAGTNSTNVFQVTVSGNVIARFTGVDSNGGWNGTTAGLNLSKLNSNNRSLNAAGTLNASGADYAEYMVKSSNFVSAKGDVVGIDANGKLTNIFADAISFVVKSTDPSFVGGDTWGINLEGDELESARQAVDRIAFAGQVPVNVTGATAGQYIVPVNDNGSIKGEAVSNPTFEQYQLAVGKVIAIESDGRAKIIVKVA